MSGSRKKIVLALVIIWIVAWQLGLFDALSLERIQAGGSIMLSTVQRYPMWSRMVFVLFYITAIALSFPSASVLTLLAGYLFGFWWGTLLANIGATTGAVILFIFVRLFFRQEMKQRYGTRLSPIHDAIAKDGIWYMLFARLVAIIPFFVVNLAAALSPLSLFNFAWTTSIGIIPGSMVYAYAGRRLHEIKRLSDVLSLQVFSAFLLLALLALLPILFKSRKDSFRKGN